MKYKKSLILIVIVSISLMLSACYGGSELSLTGLSNSVETLNTSPKLYVSPTPQSEVYQPIHLQEEIMQTSTTQDFEPLIFNVFQVDMPIMAHFTPTSRATSQVPTEEQLRAVFPYFNYFSSAIFYYEDGDFIELSTLLTIAEGEVLSSARVFIGIDKIRFDTGLPQINGNHISELPRDLEETQIYGTFVRAVILETDLFETRHFRAEFEMGDIFFRVIVDDYEEQGKELITAIINKLVLGGTAGISSLT